MTPELGSVQLTTKRLWEYIKNEIRTQEGRQV
jgi:hypothetical protein